jgi:DNA-binding transcriptional ArsR family regulator
MDSVAHAIAAPRRRAILRLVRDHEVTAGEIASHFEVTRPAISQHLRVLRDADLVVERRDGARRLYRARPEGLAELRSFVDEFWDTGLMRLKTAAEVHERGDGGHGHRA